MAAEKKYIAALEVQTGRSRQNIQEVTEALAQSGDDGVRAAGQLTHALEGVEAATANVIRKEQENKTITERDGNALIQSYARLTAAVRELEKAHVAIPETVKEALTTAKTQYDLATEKIRTTTTAVHQQRDDLSQAGAQWTGLGGAINQAMGPSGRIVAQFGLVTAAFSEGWNIGMKLNRLFGTDMSLWEEAVTRFGSKLGVIVRDQADIITGYINLIMGLVHRSPTEIKNAAVEIYNNINKAFTDLGAVFTKGGAEWDRYAASIGIHNKVAEEAAEVARKLREQKEELRKKIADVTKALRDETLELEKQKAAVEDSVIGISNAGSDQGYFQRQVASATAALAAQKAEVEDLTRKYGENNPLVIEARDKQHLLEQELRTSQERYDETSRSVEKYKEQQRQAEEAIERAKEKSKELTKQQGELEKQNARLGGTTAATATATAEAASAAQQAAASTQAAATATQAHATASSNAKREVVGYRDEQGRLHIVQRDVADSAEKVAGGMAKAAESTGAASTATTQAVSAYGAATPTVRSAATEFERLAAAMAQANEQARISIDLFGRVAEAARDLDRATKEAAGAGGEEWSGSAGSLPAPPPSVGPGNPVTGATK